MLRAGVAHRLRGAGTAATSRNAGIPSSPSSSSTPGARSRSQASARPRARSWLLSSARRSSTSAPASRSPRRSAAGRTRSPATSCSILDQAEEYFLYHAGGERVRRGAAGARHATGSSRPCALVSFATTPRRSSTASRAGSRTCSRTTCGSTTSIARAARDAVVKPVERYNELAGESIEVEPELDRGRARPDGGRARSTSGMRVAGWRADGGAPAGSRRHTSSSSSSGSGRRSAPPGSSRLRAETLVRGSAAQSRSCARIYGGRSRSSRPTRRTWRRMFSASSSRPRGPRSHTVSATSPSTRRSTSERLLPVLSTLGRERIVRHGRRCRRRRRSRYEIFHDVLGEAVLAWRREQELERERRAAERRHRRLAVVAIGALIALAAMTAVAIYAFASARGAEVGAKGPRAEVLIARVGTTLPVDPLESIDLAARAAPPRQPTIASESALEMLSSLRECGVLPAVAGRGSPAHSPDAGLADRRHGRRGREGAPLSTATGTVATLRHRGAVTDAFFRADGKRVVEQPAAMGRRGRGPCTAGYALLGTRRTCSGRGDVAGDGSVLAHDHGGAHGSPLASEGARIAPSLSGSRTPDRDQPRRPIRRSRGRRSLRPCV